MAGLGAYPLISSLNNLVANLLPEVKNTFFALSSSSSAEAPDARVVEADLRRLERMLERIKATLYDAEERNIQDKSIKLWLKEIKELGYEAEYILEEYMYEVYRAQVEARNASRLNLNKGDMDVNGAYSVLIPYGMVDRIRDIKSRFEEIAKDREALHLPEEDGPRKKKTRYTPTLTSPLVVEKSVFGRDEEKEKVINSLCLGEEVFSVLPIVGKGGIGKTTIAQLVYNDKRVQDYFDLVGWVCVSNDFNIERIGQHIIESFTRNKYDLKSPSVLLEDLAKVVRGKRIFLVLDDVWNEKKRLWESLLMPLMYATKATILVTTRNTSAARIMQTMEPLQLAYLSDDKCWLLFTHYAFQCMDPANQHDLVEIGKKILKKCSGLALAVKSIASLLSYEKELQSWVEILESDLWESDAGNEVLAALQISYERLPIYLKPCLLLCSMFPKDHKYSMNRMNRLWVAHRYIEPNGRKPIEDAAVDYTKQLYERSFFDDYNIEWDRYGLPIDATFRLHDMVHDLAWINSEKTCCSVEQGEQPFISKEVHHLHLNKGLRELTEFLCSIKISFKQTLIMRRSRSLSDKDHKQISLDCLSKAEHLRALDLLLIDSGMYYEDMLKENVLPFSLRNMKHLRYLSVGVVERFLPESIFTCYSLQILILHNYEQDLDRIGNLINLEFLQLNYTRVVQLPESLSFLKKLRVLEIHRHNTCYYTFELPKCIENLEELHRIVITGGSFLRLPDSICRFTNLKELIIKTRLKALPKDFGNLTNLQLLFLRDLWSHIPRSLAKLIPTCIGCVWLHKDK